MTKILQKFSGFLSNLNFSFCFKTFAFSSSELKVNFNKRHGLLSLFPIRIAFVIATVTFKQVENKEEHLSMSSCFEFLADPSAALDSLKLCSLLCSELMIK